MQLVVARLRKREVFEITVTFLLNMLGKALEYFGAKAIFPNIFRKESRSLWRSWSFTFGVSRARLNQLCDVLNSFENEADCLFLKQGLFVLPSQVGVEGLR
jgi:hypothetical protein